MKRSEFLKIGSLACGGLVLTIPLACKKGTEQPQRTVNYSTLNAYLKIGSDNSVEIVNPVPEIGQNVSTALPMLVAEELDVEWENIRVVQANADMAFGGRDQRAAGSNSVRVFWKPMREAGAAAKSLLLQAAAKKWAIPQEECYAKQGMVHNKFDDNTLAYGELSNLAATFSVPEEIALKPKSEFRLIGTNPKNKTIAGILAGTTKFGFDIQVPGMLYASVEKGPVYGATVKSFNKQEILDLNGIEDAFILPFHGDDGNRPYCREGIAVVGQSTWDVLKARKALNIAWDLGENTDESTAGLHRQCQDLIAKKGHFTVKNEGDFYPSLEKEDISTIASVYHVPPIVHVPMEPVNCTVVLAENSCELWSTTQMPFIELNYLANFLKMPKENITLHVPRIGGGFGRRLGVDFTLEGVKIAQKVKKPIHFFWTREDDIGQSAFRPFSYHRMVAGVDRKRKELVSWLHRQASTSRYAFRKNAKPFASEFFPNHFPANLLPNFRQEYSLSLSNLQRTLIRAPGNNALAFPVESFIDEIAHELQQDPLEFRMRLLGDPRNFPFDEEEGSVISTERMKGVLELVAAKAGWGKDLPKEVGMGIAAYFTFDTYVAHVMEVSVDPITGQVTIYRVTSAIDCGQVLNPDGVRAQVEGAIHDGLSVALYQEITVTNGATDQSNFHDYPLLRMKDAPYNLNVHIVQNEHPPTGVGEPPYPPVFPALCNAIYAACGKRIRRLPIGDQLKIKNHENTYTQHQS